jgi:phosphate:Na+ symporter
MGQNIGTCVSAMISSIGTGKNARRAAVIHLSFNIIATVIILPLFYLINYFVEFAFMNIPANYVSIAVVHTSFKLVALVIIAPFAKYLEKLATLIVREGEKSEEAKLLDERFFTVPSVAIERSKTVAVNMADVAVMSIRDAMKLLDTYSEKEANKIRELESKVDMYEDKLGSYLVKLSNRNMTEADSADANKLLHVIGDVERISDHAVNIVESAEEMHDKNLEFSAEAKRELDVITGAVSEILGIAFEAFEKNDLETAMKVEPLEQVVDNLRDELKKNHVARLRTGECTIELGFVFSDLLTNLERISDHCSNIAGCVIEMSRDELDIHEYLRAIKNGEGSGFYDNYEFFKNKYSIKSAE